MQDGVLRFHGDYLLWGILERRERDFNMHVAFISRCAGALATSVIALAVHAQAPISAAAPVPDCRENTPLQRPLEYPSVEIDDAHRLLFRLCAPRVQDARVTSSEVAQIPTGYDGREQGLPMTRDTQGYWVARIDTPVRPGPFRYAFKLDGTLMADPQSSSFSELNRGVQSVYEVPGHETAYQAFSPGIPHGLVSTIRYRSQALGIERRMHVYTPPGYERAQQRRYPVLYLVHGAGDSDDSWTSIGHAQNILDNLIAQGRAEPMILVMPQGHTPDRVGVERMRNTDFATDLTQDVIPMIDARFRTVPQARSRAMAGLSMGGAHTIHFGLPRPDLFGAVGIFSIGIAEADMAEYRARNEARLRQRAKSGGLVYYAAGRDDFLKALFPPTRKMMADYGLEVVDFESDGGHEWANWRDYLHRFLPLLFRPAA